MASRQLSGSTTAFWNNVAVSSGGTSNEVEIARNTEHILIYVTTSAATTISIEVAPKSAITSEGIWPENEGSGSWFPLVVPGTTATPVQHVFASSGSAAIAISDFVPRMIRLKSSAAATITAGFETITG